MSGYGHVFVCSLVAANELLRKIPKGYIDNGVKYLCDIPKERPTRAIPQLTSDIDDRTVFNSMNSHSSLLAPQLSAAARPFIPVSNTQSSYTDNSVRFRDPYKNIN